METECIRGSEVFERLADEWDELAGRGMTATPFQLLAYQRAWWEHLGPGELYTIVVREDGKPAAIGCFYLHEGVLHFNGSVEESDYLDLIAPAEQAEAGWQAVLDELSRPDFPAWQQLELWNIPAESPSREILPRLAAGRGWSFDSQVSEVCPVITLPATFEDYLNSLDKKQRHELRRKLRRSSAEDVVLHQVSAEDNLRQEVDDFLFLLQQSTPDKNAWLNDERRQVFHEVAAAALEEGTLQLLFLQIEGQKAAALFNFDYRNRIWVYNSGLDPQAFGYLSPGVVLTAQAIERAIENGRETFDFMRGSEEYKYRFGAVDTTIYRLTMRR